MKGCKSMKDINVGKKHSIIGSNASRSNYQGSNTSDSRGKIISAIYVQEDKHYEATALGSIMKYNSMLDKSWRENDGKEIFNILARSCPKINYKRIKEIVPIDYTKGLKIIIKRVDIEPRYSGNDLYYTFNDGYGNLIYNGKNRTLSITLQNSFSSRLTREFFIFNKD